MSETKTLIELLHEASIALSNFESQDTKVLERRIDGVLLKSPLVLENDKLVIREYWEEARDE